METKRLARSVCNITLWQGHSARFLLSVICVLSVRAISNENGNRLGRTGTFRSIHIASYQSITGFKFHRGILFEDIGESCLVNTMKVGPYLIRHDRLSRSAGQSTGYARRR